MGIMLSELKKTKIPLKLNCFKNVNLTEGLKSFFSIQSYSKIEMIFKQVLPQLTVCFRNYACASFLFLIGKKDTFSLSLVVQDTVN